jgi:hypothetical protein
VHLVAGTPCVFYDHLWQERDGLRKQILALLELRKRHGIHARWVWVCAEGGREAGPHDWVWSCES